VIDRALLEAVGLRSAGPPCVRRISVGCTLSLGCGGEH
jgi:hypothetical protein